MGFFKGLVFKAEGLGVLIMIIGFGLALWKRTKKGQMFYEKKIKNMPFCGKFLTFYLGWPLGILGFLMAFPDAWNDIWNWTLGTVALVVIYVYMQMKKTKEENAKKAAEKEAASAEESAA